MEVRNIGQGGQTSFDNITAKGDAEKPVIESGSGIAQTTESSQPASTTQKTDENHTDHDKKINDQELKKALDKLSNFINNDDTTVEYQYHNKFNDLMIKIVNKNTKEVILEIPPKKILDLVAKMMEMVGVLFDKKA